MKHSIKVVEDDYVYYLYDGNFLFQMIFKSPNREYDRNRIREEIDEYKRSWREARDEENFIDFSGEIDR
ncbi:MAG: hypothetical protein ACUVXI_00645 [bacterium]